MKRAGRPSFAMIFHFRPFGLSLTCSASISERTEKMLLKFSLLKPSGSGISDAPISTMAMSPWLNGTENEAYFPYAE